MTSLYVMTQEFIEIADQLEEMELDAETIKDTLDSVQAPLEQKVENIVKYMRSLEALSAARKEEAKKLTELAGKDLKKAECLKKYMTDNLKNANIKELQAGIFSLKFKKGTESTVINESELPEQYWIPQEPKPMSKTELKKLLKEGQEIPGVSLVRGEESLVIK